LGKVDSNCGSSRRDVLQGITVATLSATGISASRAAGQSASQKIDLDHWWTQDYRIVQTNLREIDAKESPREIARAIKEFGGNAIVSNIGGIVAFYPTALEFHRKSPYLNGDFVRDMIDASHDADLAYFGRFDTTKAWKNAYDAHPDWFIVDRTGLPREYDGTYAACPNGRWAKDYSQQIIEEALQRYRPDGIFFNGAGFGQVDYSNVNHGICVCPNCKRVFREMFNRDLPKVDGFSDPAWKDYLAFQERVVAAQMEKGRENIHRLVPGVPIFAFEGAEVVGRGELQRRVYRPAPEWSYQGGEQARMAFAVSPGKPFSSTSTAHMDYPWRQVTETAACHELRFAQQLGAGAHLDLYLMGSLADQDDQSYLPPISRLFKWRAANGAHYSGMTQAARVGIYTSRVTERLGGMTPYRAYQTGAARGAYMALVDSRIPFQFISDERVADGTTKLSDSFDAVVMPNVMMVSPAEATALDDFVRAGGLIIATGITGGYTPNGEAASPVLMESFPLRDYSAPSNAHGWSLDPKKSQLEVIGRVPIDAFYFGGALKSGVSNILPFAPDQRFGPPELCYAIPGVGARDVPGIALLSYGKGHVVHIPWLPDWQYYRDGMPVHQQIYSALISKYSAPQNVALNGVGPVELMHLQRGRGGARLLHVVNFAGQRNGLYGAAPELHGISVGVRGISAKFAHALVSGRLITGRHAPNQGEMTWFDLPPIGAFEAILIDR
jgi:hypothetical protein